MKYMGSKNRIAKYILPVMLKHRIPGMTWVEPFVGGGNLIDKVTGERIGADLNSYSIEALIAIRDCIHDLPKNNKEFTESDYKKLKETDDYKYKGFAGFAYSYGGKYLGGWARDGKGRRDYVHEAYKNALKQSPKLRGVTFIQSSYRTLQIPCNSLIYCDPPYAETTKYKDNFDHKIFWQWCRDKTEEGHLVFVSEYAAPSDFDCICQTAIVTSLTQDTGDKIGIEKLFRYNSEKPKPTEKISPFALGTRKLRKNK